MVGLTLSNELATRDAAGRVTIHAGAVAISRIDGVFTTERLVTFVAAEAFWMVHTAFGGELAAFDRAIAAIARRGRARNALNLSVDQLVFQALDGVVARDAGEALVVEALALRGDVSSIEGELAAALGAARGCRHTTHGGLVHGRLLTSVGLLVHNCGRGALARDFRLLVEEVVVLLVKLVGALWCGHVGLGTGGAVGVILEGVVLHVVNVGSSGHDEMGFFITSNFACCSNF